MSKAVIEEENRNIMASITYARKIQQASLPTEERLKNVLKDYFIIFRPRDIVSGDFYWFGQSGRRHFIAAVDCSGHGVPGAFLSMMGNMELTEIVKEKPVHDPAALLMHLHNAIGGRQREKKRTFKNHAVPIRSETVLYLTTDGFADQNNSENKKYGSLRLKQFLQAHAHLPMDRQQEAILLELKDHQGVEEQRDDITIIGIKLKGSG